METNLFNNTSNKNKNKNNSSMNTITKFPKIDSYKGDPSPALIQGNNFKNYQKKIAKNLVKNTDVNNYKEAFTNPTLEKKKMGSKNNSNPTNLFQETNKVIKETDFSPKTNRIDTLKQEYTNTLNQYNTLLNQLNGTTNKYFQRVSSSNPYLGKNIYSTVTPGPLGYVTMQGVFKWYPDWNIVNATAGSNGCPAISEETWKSAISVNVPIDYNNEGSIIKTTPPLIVGSPMIAGQSCGNEGSNVYVNSLINKNSPVTYEGCFQDSLSSPTMTFIGQKPTIGNSKIQNGNFSDPQLSNNSYQYFTDNSSVPGWNISNAALLNNSSAWGFKMPYPSGDQCISIQMTSFISQMIALVTETTYTLSFNASGRNCCDDSGLTNPINIFLNDSNDLNTNNTIYSFESKIDAWNSYSTSFTVPKTGNYMLKIQGTQTTDRSTAIQNIQILDKTITSSSNGTYSLDSCKQAALYSGYQYFGLQNVNPSTALGYCTVSNSEPSSTKLGPAKIPNKTIPIWSSNTSGQTGNSATLTPSGSLSVLNSSGTSVFSTENSTALPSNYIGCYGDENKRAMLLYNNGSQSYDYEQCSEIATKNGYSYFGLQNSTSGTNAQCALSNDLTSAREYGKAGNCTTLVDGTISGGGWSNAIYNNAEPSSIYFLILQDDGNMCIYRGSNPNDNQGNIWVSNTNGKQQKPNPTYQASNSKYGKNWITSGDTLAAGDFIGSTDGSIYLIMQSDGNLVLNTSQDIENCSKMSDGQMGGGINANALYNIGQKGFSRNIGKIGYVDPNAQLLLYESNNLQFNQNYSTFSGNNPGNDIPGTQYNNASLKQCKNTCNSNDSCAGFVFDNKNSVCWPKDSTIFPNSSLVPNSGDNDFSTLIRNKQPIQTPNGVSKEIKNTDSITYQNYSNGGNFESKNGLAKFTSIQQQELSQLESTLNLLTNKLNELTNNYVSSSEMVNDQSKKNQMGLENYTDELLETEQKIKQFPLGPNPLLEDSNIVLLQKNYEYLLWGSIAIGLLIITLGFYRK